MTLKKNQDLFNNIFRMADEMLFDGRKVNRDSKTNVQIWTI